jgi:hypothetical protein
MMSNMLSYSSWMDGLNRSCTNTPRGNLRLDPSRARASGASLSHERI